MSKFKNWLIKKLGGQTEPSPRAPVQYIYTDAHPQKLVAETYLSLCAVKGEEGPSIEKYAYQRLAEMLAQKMIDSKMVYYDIEDDTTAEVRRYRAYINVLEEPHDKMS